MVLLLLFKHFLAELHGFELVREVIEVHCCCLLLEEVCAFNSDLGVKVRA